MNQESNFLNQWFHLRYQEDLSEFDDGLSLSNLYALVGAGRLLGSVLLLAAVMLHRHCGVAWLHLLPSLLVGAGMIVLVERLWRVVRKPRLQGEVLLVSDRWIWLFLPVMFAMAFYYDFYLQVSDGHWALCLALLAAGALFHITFLKSMGMFGAVLVIFFVVQHVTTDQLIWTVQSGTIMLAAVFGLFFSHQKMRGTLTALLEVKMYGDNVIEKHGINRDSTGDREKTRYLCGKQGIFTRDRALIRPGFIRQLETRASTRSASFFHALGSPGRPYNGGGEAGAYRTRNGAKPLKQGHLRAKRGPLGPSRKSQQQTKRTGFAAHGHSIAETAPEGKRASCANGALIRA